MPREYHKDRRSHQFESSTCPWWSQNIGLGPYIRYCLLKKNSIHLDLSFFEITAGFFSIILGESTSSVNSISLEGCKGLTDDDVQYLAEHFQIRTNNSLCLSKSIVKVHNAPLLALNLHGCSLLTDHACIHIAKHFHRLEFLDIGNCMNIRDKGFITLIKACKYISKLHIQNLLLQDESLSTLKNNLILTRLLSVLDMSGCNGFTNDAILSFFESNPNTIRNINFSYIPQLNLGLSGLQRSNSSGINRVVLDGIFISDSMMSWIGKGCKCLLELHLSRCTGINSLSLMYLFSGSDIRLQVLNLSFSDKVSNETLMAFEESNGAEMDRLDLTHCSRVTSEGLIHVSKTCRKIQTIFLSGVSFCENGIIAIAERCTFLREINVSDSKSAVVPRIDKRSLRVIGASCNRLQVLIAGGCCRLDDDAIVSFAKGCTQVVELDFSRCYKISNKALHAIGKYCKLLRKISLVSCDVSSVGVDALTIGCPLLEFIDLSNAIKINDDAINHLANRCSQLKMISLNNCDRVSEVGIHSLIQSLPGITRLDLRGLDLVSSHVFSVSELKYLRYADFEGTALDVLSVQKIQSRSLFGAITGEGKLSIRPKYHSQRKHLQHCKYLSFLLKNRNSIVYAIRRYMLMLRCKKRKVLWDCCSIKIQCIIRKYLCMKKYQDMCLRKSRHDSALRINQIIQKYLLRKEYQKRRIASELICRSIDLYLLRVKARGIMKAQRKKILRAQIARTKAYWFCQSLLILMKTLREQKHCVIKIQEYWRTIVMVRSERRRIRMKLRFLCWTYSFIIWTRQKRLQENHAAKCIQAFFNNYQSRNAAFQSAKELYHIKKAQQKASLTIASFCHAQITSKRNLNRKRAAETIQNFVRSSNKRRHILTLWKICIRKLPQRDQACCKIQNWYQQIYQRRTHSVILIQTWANMMHQSALIIQKWFLSIHSKRILTSTTIICNTIYSRVLRKRILNEKLQANASITIQYWMKCIYFKCVYKKKIKSIHQLQSWWRRRTKRSTYLAIFKMIIIEYNNHERERKRYLLKQKRKREIMNLFTKSRNHAAFVIQRFFKYLVASKRLAQVLREEDETLKSVLAFEKRKMEEIQKEAEERRKMRFKIRKAFKIIKDNAINLFKRMVRIRKEAKMRTFNIQERASLASDLLMYYYLGNGSYMFDSVNQYQTKLRNTFGMNLWYDEQCEICMLKHLIWPEELMYFRKLWIEEIDFRSIEMVSVHNFFNCIGEAKSEYGLWIVRFVLGGDISRDIPFSTYFNLVVSSCLLSKLDLLRIAFTSMSKYGKFMTQYEWDCLVNTVLENDGRIQFALKCFETYSIVDSRGDRVLLFNNFVRLSNHNPFLMASLFKLHSNIRRVHAGEMFWKKKGREISIARSKIHS